MAANSKENEVIIGNYASVKLGDQAIEKLNRPATRTSYDKLCQFKVITEKHKMRFFKRECKACDVEDEDGNIKACGVIYMHNSCMKCDKASIVMVGKHLENIDELEVKRHGIHPEIKQYLFELLDNSVNILKIKASELFAHINMQQVWNDST